MQKNSIPWKKIIGGVMAFALVAMGVGWGGKWLYWRIRHVTTNAAYVKADIANVAPEVHGKVVRILAKEGQPVRKGDILFRIDPEQIDRQLALAEAELNVVRSKSDRYHADLSHARGAVPAVIEAARAAVEVSERQKVKTAATLDHWSLMQKRYRELYARAVIGKAKLDEVETAWKNARADDQAAEAAVTLAKARRAEAEASRATIASSEAAYRESSDGIRKAREAVKLAQLSRSRCDVAAPISGVVARVLLKEGDFAAAGRPAVGLYDPETRYIEARFEETKVRHIRPGKLAEFAVDADDGRVLRGRVQYVAPASAAEFALIPRDVSAGEFTKVVQRIPVRIAIEDLQKHPELLPGMSCEVWIAR